MQRQRYEALLGEITHPAYRQRISALSPHILDGPQHCPRAESETRTAVSFLKQGLPEYADVWLTRGEQAVAQQEELRQLLTAFMLSVIWPRSQGAGA